MTITLKPERPPFKDAFTRAEERDLRERSWPQDHLRAESKKDLALGTEMSDSDDSDRVVIRSNN